MSLGDILKIAAIVVPVALYIVSEIRRANTRTNDEIGKVHVLVNSANDRLKSEIADLKKIVESQAVEIKLLREREGRS